MRETHHRPSRSRLPTKRSVAIIGVPLDLGSGRRGVDMGPSAIRYAHLDQVLVDMGLHVEDMGNLSVPIPESQTTGNTGGKYEREIYKVCVELSREVEKAAARGRVPVCLGGDHSIAMGSITGVAKVRGPIGVLWFDAHGDFNTPETSPTGNVHGMPLASVMGYGSARLVNFCKSAGIRPENCALVGVRDVDPLEKKLLAKAGVRVYTMESVDRMGLNVVMERALADVTRDTDGFHLSFDIDVVDPSAAPGVGTPALGGISYREAMTAVEMCSDTRKVTSLDMVEVNPIMDLRNQTAQIAVSLIACALGKRIL